VKSVEVTLGHTMGYYWNACSPTPCSPPPLLLDALAKAVAAKGASFFNNVDGISVLSTFCARDYTN
jgi:hypothetical protein